MMKSMLMAVSALLAMASAKSSVTYTFNFDTIKRGTHNPEQHGIEFQYFQVTTAIPSNDYLAPASGKNYIRVSNNQNANFIRSDSNYRTPSGQIIQNISLKGLYYGCIAQKSSAGKVKTGSPVPCNVTVTGYLCSSGEMIPIATAPYEPSKPQHGAVAMAELSLEAPTCAEYGVSVTTTATQGAILALDEVTVRENLSS